MERQDGADNAGQAHEKELRPARTIRRHFFSEEAGERADELSKAGKPALLS